MENTPTHAPEQNNKRFAYVAYGLAIPKRNWTNLTIKFYGGKPSFRVEQTHLLNVLTPDDHCVILAYEKCTLELVGRDLHPLAQALTIHVMSFATVYLPDWHTILRPSDPVIEAIRWKATVMDGEERIPMGRLQEGVSEVVFD